MIHERLPAVARTITHKFDNEVEGDGCLGELKSAAALLDHHGFVGRPEWEQLQMGVRPPPANIVEPGVWPHGLQYFALCFRALLQEDGGVEPDGCRKPSSFALSFRTRVVLRVEWDSDPTGVQRRTTPLPHVGARKNEVAPARGRGQVRVWGRVGQFGASPGGVSKVRHTANQSLGTRKITGQDLPGGGSHSAMQCQAEGHGHRRVCTRRESNRSAGIGAPTAPRSTARG